jgi:hypothetical protein
MVTCACAGSPARHVNAAGAANRVTSGAPPATVTTGSGAVGGELRVGIGGGVAPPEFELSPPEHAAEATRTMSAPMVHATRRTRGEVTGRPRSGE